MLLSVYLYGNVRPHMLLIEKIYVPIFTCPQNVIEVSLEYRKENSFYLIWIIAASHFIAVAFGQPCNLYFPENNIFIIISFY